MIDTPADLFNLTAAETAIEDLGVAITSEIRVWMDSPTDPRSDGEVAVDFFLSPTQIHLVAPVLVAAGWRPPEHILATLTTTPHS